MTFYKIGVLLFTLTIGISLKAQDETPLKTSEYFESPLIGRSYTAPPKGQGSPYLFDSWLNGSVMLINGDTVKNRLFKLDCFKNEFLWMSDGKSIIALDHNLISGFTLFPSNGSAERNFVKTSLKLPMLSDTFVRYLEVLALGEINLYAYRKVTVSTEPTIGSNGGLYQFLIYENEPYYFIQSGNRSVKQVKFQKKSIIGAYPDLSIQLKKVLRENHSGGIKNEYQLKQAIITVNSNWN